MSDVESRLLADTFKFRLSEADRRALNRNAAELGVTPSAYLRGVAVLPARAFGIAESSLKPANHSNGAIVVYDTASILKLHMQLRRWGYHLDGSLKALNTIAKKEFMRPEDAERVCLDAVAAMGEVAAARESIEARIDTLAKSWSIRAAGVLQL